MPLKILYDHQIFTIQKIGGISRYFYEIMNNLPSNISFQCSGIFSNNIYIRDIKKNRANPLLPNYDFKGKSTLMNLPNTLSSLASLRKGEYDIFHPTYYNPYFLKKNKKPFVLTIHDMVHEKFPSIMAKEDKTSFNKKLLVYKAKHIIAVSENTKIDILKAYDKLSPDKVSVVYHANSLVNPGRQIDSGFKNYILFTGGRGGYKNFNTFIHAAAPLALKYNISIVCTGMPFSPKELILFGQLHIAGKVFHKFASEEELFFLYKNAIAFIFPSLYEGFGIPILEAFCAECPVALSNTSCFPEIAGDCAFYFDPLSIEDMRSVIEKLIINPSLRSNFTSKGTERLKLFNWKKSSEETAIIYSSI
ncbi:glycosyltransferase family 4 protein [Parasediminibacterium sp. JCM 36343]|uniref:glycosyltransferase family 4 protein n=1 Tax=Parasediminibacterium sp. JCM 36343 TaxID=3374279 RepID=UPI0039787DDE